MRTSLSKKLFAGLALGASLLSVAACGKNTTTTTGMTDATTTTDAATPTITRPTIDLKSDAVYVKKIENLSDDFMLGVDTSAVISLEESGVKYYGYDGKEQDVFKTLAESGVNYIRLRVWNDPYDAEGHGYGGGNNDIDKAVEMGKRATSYGMKVAIDFHYSDFWADPAKQFAPKAWKDMKITEKTEACYQYTKDCLTKLKENNVAVGLVQVGNETNNGVAGETKWKNMCSIFNAGSKAVREIFPEAQVAVHFANPEKADRYSAYANNLKLYAVDYDIFASSYYPYWHGTLDNLSAVLSQVAETHNKKVMVAETSYCYTTEDYDFHSNTISAGSGVTQDYPFTISGQVNNLTNIVDTIVNKTTNGVGVFYWEGTWLPVGTSSWEENMAKWEKYGSGWATSYAASYDPDDVGNWYGGCAVDNQTLFDSTGHPLESLKAFGLMQTGNIIEKFVDGVENVEITHYTTDDFQLPETVNVIYCDNSRAPAPVVWEDFDLEAAKKAGNGKYTINGSVDGKPCQLKLILMEYNFVQNYGFEQGKDDITPWVSSKLESGSNFNVGPTSENPQSGKFAFHFYGAAANAVNFQIEQELTGLITGTYKYQISILGGASGTTDKSLQDIYAYVKIDGEIVYKKSVNFTTWDDGYHDCLIENIQYTAGQKIEIGINVTANQAGSWGDIDDVMFNYVG